MTLTLVNRLVALENAKIEVELGNIEAELRTLGRQTGRGYAEEHRRMREFLRRHEALPDDAGGRLMVGPWAALMTWCADQWGGTPDLWAEDYRAAVAEEHAATG